MLFGRTENFLELVKSLESFFVVFAHFGHTLFLKSILHLFLYFNQARFSLRTFCSTRCMTMIRCALHSPGSRRPLGHVICVDWTRRNFLKLGKVTVDIFGQPWLL